MQRNKAYIRNIGIYTVISKILMFTDYLSKFSCTISLLNHMPSSYIKPVCACAATTATKAHTHNKICMIKIFILLQSCLSFNI